MVDLSQVLSLQQQATEYLYGLPDEVLKGNVFAIAVFFILLYIAIFIVQKFTTLLVFALKKVFLLIIVALAFIAFLQAFSLKIATEGMTADTIVFGIGGVAIGLMALFIALYVALHSIRSMRKEPGAEAGTIPSATEREPAPPPPAEVPAVTREKETAPPEGPAPKPSLTAKVKDEISLATLKSDKRIGAVIAYVVIAEFGVFSSKTIAAPNIGAGLMFFIAFLLASIVFIRLTYRDYWRGIRHLGAALIFGIVLSITLGYFWGGIPLEQLLSLSYFTTDALVALITGLALSLFMGSMN
jgi:energy-coupling factor transporter transmembrane protein EcfT